MPAPGDTVHPRHPLRVAMITAIGATAVAAIVGIVTASLGGPPAAAPSSERALPPCPAAAPAATSSPLPAPPSPNRDAPPRPEPPVAGTPFAAPSQDARVAAATAAVHLHADAVVATVDGVPLTGADLGVTDEHDLSPERFARLRRSAIAHHLVARAAHAEGVSLDAAQERAREALRERSLAPDPRVADRAGLRPEGVERDLRTVETGMLLDALGAARGVPARDVTPAQVQAYYQDHRDAFPAPGTEPFSRDPAWRPIEVAIRATLAREVAAAHDDALTALEAALWSAAEVELSPIP